jgi:hypothetical protein
MTQTGSAPLPALQALVRLLGRQSAREAQEAIQAGAFCAAMSIPDQPVRRSRAKGTANHPQERDNDH